MSIERRLLAVQGYIELQMFDEALAELENLPLDARRREDSLHLKLFVLMRAKRWDSAIGVCSELRDLNADSTTGYIHGAFCLHEIGRTSEAKRLLLSGPASLLQEPTYYYNLGCYDAVLGNLEEAQRSLRISFQMDEKFREIAKHDPDLKAVASAL